MWKNLYCQYACAVHIYKFFSFPLHPHPQRYKLICPFLCFIYLMIRLSFYKHTLCIQMNTVRHCTVRTVQEMFVLTQMFRSSLFYHRSVRQLSIEKRSHCYHPPRVSSSLLSPRPLFQSYLQNSVLVSSSNSNSNITS